ncbi:MAG: VCBS repeat-containing protein [Balneolaceae bacterium]|nr:VCBS repeat-containing protein [Balneolaceae bacterium]
MTCKCNLLAIAAFLLLLVSGCALLENGEQPLFTKLDPLDTGVDFNNRITSSDSLNIQNYPFMFNGGGVAIGDVNNDGLPDLYVTGNMVSSRLYLNRGEMQFEDVTEKAGVATDRWTSGVSMVDINADGYLDIYVSAVSTEQAPPESRANLLFVNNGDTTFTESAAEYNLDYTGFTTHSAFLDYDRDGDLDLFLLNHSPGSFARNMGTRAPSVLFGLTDTSFDELYRNDGGTFTRVTRQAGLSREEGFGLGVAVSDFNRDGWPDIYVSNDILPDDILYINNGDGTFSDKTDEFLKHTSFAGMGVDVADFNNDGWPDISQVDMMPENLNERKRMSGGITYTHYREMREKGFYYQYSINTLQLSNGIDRNGNVIFSEVGRMAGVAYTDWSWSALFGDYDNDGLKDLLITNGFPKAINNYDYLTEMNQAGQFGTPKVRHQRKMAILEELDSIKVSNYLFKNRGDHTFSNKTADWNFTEPTYSFGASHGDLDNDGDLDIVINNINARASIYRNESDTLRRHHYLTLKLRGSPQNPDGIGSRVRVVTGEQQQFQYLSPYRGYQSGTDLRLHFGLGNYDTVDSLEVIWPDGKAQVLHNLSADLQVTLDYSEAQRVRDTFYRENSGNKLVEEVTDSLDIPYLHRENEYNDYNTQGLLPYQFSRLGPPLAAADLNGDGLTDLYVGGSSGQPGSIFIQSEEGRFVKQESPEPWNADSRYEDVGAEFFDADGDGDQDLYVSSGGYEFSPASTMYQDRLYINRGGGVFVNSSSSLPPIQTSSSCVEPGDYDKDGDLDLFVCGRVVPRRYPEAARSYILQNDGGQFTDVTPEIAPGLTAPGMVTDAVWSDYNGDGQLDLVITGEWMPVQFFRQKNGQFEVSESLRQSLPKGWWFSLAEQDVDRDGDPDYIAGNLGLNYGYVTGDDRKFELFASDFDRNQTLDLLFAVHRDGEHYPYYGKAKLGMKIPGINKKFKTYRQFSEATVEEVVGTAAFEDAKHLQVDTFAHMVLENRGGEDFSFTPLPNESQISSVNSIITRDVDNDGNTDLVFSGNMYNTEPQTARNDAGNGMILLGNGTGSFNAVSPFNSGFLTPGHATSMQLIDMKTGKALVVANNSDSLQVFHFHGDETGVRVSNR